MCGELLSKFIHYDAPWAHVEIPGPLLRMNMRGYHNMHFRNGDGGVSSDVRLH
jgi:hypothetical protein